MKKIIFGLNLILLLSVICFGQKQKKQPNQVDDVPQKQNSKSVTKNNDILLQSGTSIEAQLQKTIDVKKAEVGDQVVLTTTKNIKQNGEVVVPKGARLIGRVTEVQQKTRENKESKLGVIFDRLEGKNLSAPISATIVSITQANANAMVGDSVGSDISGNSNSSGTVSGTGSGGLLGGVSNTVGGVVNTTTNTVGGATNTVGQTVGGTTQTLGGTLNGIRITQAVNASVNNSTMLSAQNKNLKVEKGATFHLLVNETVQK